MTLAPALLRMWLDVDDDDVWDTVTALLNQANAVEARAATWDTARFLASLLCRVRRDYPEVVGDLDDLTAEWGVKLAAGEPL